MDNKIHYQKLNIKNFKVLKQNILKLDNKSIRSRYGQMLSSNKIIESIEASQLTILVFKGKYLAGFGQVFKLKQQKYPEIGYIIFKKYRGKGLGFLLTKRILTYCNKKNIKIKGEATLPNKASVKVLKKVSRLFPPVKAFISPKYQPNTYVCYWKF